MKSVSGAEEAAASLGASRMHIFRTVTLPLLIPGIAGSFLLLFVESLADLGNPLFIAGNKTVLSAQIFLAVIGEYDYQKASALSLVLIIPTLFLFLAQRYYVNRRSYISVTGKPSGAQITEKDPFIRWGFNIAAYLVCAFVVLLYATIIYGSFSFTWGVDFPPTLRHWSMVVTRGVEAILDTTFLSALATPFAAFLVMVIAWLVVRKNFSGKEALDFSSNLGGAVPGTVLGIGFILVFNKPPLALAVVIYAVLALFFVLVVGKDARRLKAFYSDLFGWEFQDIGGPMNYGVVQRAGNTNPEGAGIGGGVGGDEDYAGHVIFYVEVPDIEAALARAESLGGRRVMGPDEVPEAGILVAHLSDPEGHVIGAVQSIEG